MARQSIFVASCYQPFGPSQSPTDRVYSADCLLQHDLGPDELRSLNEWEEHEMVNPTCPYYILSVKRDAHDHHIKDTFLKHTAHYSPTGCVGGQSLILLIRAQRAYTILSDSLIRKRLDDGWKERVKNGHWSRLRYGNGYYEGETQIDHVSEKLIRAGKGSTVVGHEFFEGDYQHDMRQGVGLCIFQNGDMYLGQWREDQMTGTGIYYHVNGGRYIGDFSCGRRHGQGVHTWPDGSLYSGAFEEGCRCGYGVLELAGPAGGDAARLKYEGEWSEGKLSGTGQCTLPDGTVYRGEFVEGSFHGEGVMKMPCGDTYTGSFCKGRRHGHGMYSWANGECYAGIWDKNRLGGADEAAPDASKIDAPGAAQP